MYIFKNAVKCISRAKSRNVLIGIIALIIAISVCGNLCQPQNGRAFSPPCALPKNAYPIFVGQASFLHKYFAFKILLLEVCLLLDLLLGKAHSFRDGN